MDRLTIAQARGGRTPSNKLAALGPACDVLIVACVIPPDERDVGRRRRGTSETDRVRVASRAERPRRPRRTPARAGPAPQSRYRAPCTHRRSRPWSSRCCERESVGLGQDPLPCGFPSPSRATDPRSRTAARPDSIAGAIGSDGDDQHDAGLASNLRPSSASRRSRCSNSFQRTSESSPRTRARRAIAPGTRRGSPGKKRVLRRGPPRRCRRGHRRHGCRRASPHQQR